MIINSIHETEQEAAARLAESATDAGSGETDALALASYRIGSLQAIIHRDTDEIKELKAQLALGTTMIEGYRVRLQECGARNIELEAQLAEANREREIERTWKERNAAQAEMLTQAVEKIGATKSAAEAEAARLKEVAGKIFAKAEKVAQLRGLEKHFKTFRAIEIQLSEDDIAALAPESTAPAEEVKG